MVSMKFDLSPDLAAFIEASVNSGRFASAEDAVRASIVLMQDAAHVAAAEGNEITNLRRLFSKLRAAKDERDFIIALMSRARLIPHPEAIMQMAAEALGIRLKASRRLPSFASRHAVEDGQAVSLLFTDIVMPEMTGRELAERARAKLPHLKVVYTTGYTRNAIVHNGILDHGVNFLAKPFRIDQLASLDSKSVGFPFRVRTCEQDAVGNSNTIVPC